MKQDWETLIPLLVHIQANLDQDLSLERLGRKAGLSPFHLQRLFKAAIGETPKAYTSRLRVERAAFRLLIHESSVLDIALECGFQNHETFIRAFHRRYGMSPRDYRKWAASSRIEHAEGVLPSQEFEISATKVIRLRPMHLAFRRHVGPYESVPESIFDELEEWAIARAVPGPPVWMGIGHDAPVTTPPQQLRFDAALVVAGPFAAEGRIGYQFMEGGDYAVTTHAGSYETLPAAYGAIFPRVMSLAGYQFVGVPVVEIYHTAKVNVRYQLNHTDICLPVVRVGGEVCGTAMFLRDLRGERREPSSRS